MACPTASSQDSARYRHIDTSRLVGAGRICYLRRMTADLRNSQTLADLSLWIAAQMLAGETETRILDGLCERLAALGVVLKRVIIGADTLHPVLEGRAFEWRREQAVKEVEYGRQAAIGVSDSWRRSPFYYLL